MKNKHRSYLWLRGIVLIVVLAMSACGGGAPAADVPPAEQTSSLTVLDWAGYDAPDFWVDLALLKSSIKSEFIDVVSKPEDQSLHGLCR